MQRNTGALASLNATYTGSDDSEGEDDIATSLEIKQTKFAPIVPAPAVGRTPIHLQSQVVSEPFTFTANFGKHDNDSTELGHITDEEQSNASGKGEDSDDDIEDGKPKESTKDSLSVNSVSIPPEPKQRCSNHLQEKFITYFDKMSRDGLDMNAVIQNTKQFRNPSIYEKLIQFCQIDELGTNYAPEIYDPSQFGPSSYYEELAKAQKTEMDKRQKEQKERTKVEFISGTAKKLGGSGDAPTLDDSKKRKSKWDVGSMQGIPLATLLKPATMLVQPPGMVPLTTVPTGTKAMVISAFGTIAKKSKQ